MTIEAEELAIQQNDSVELYTFEFGISPNIEYYYMTTYYKDFTGTFETFIATAGLRRSGYQNTTDTTPSEIKITIPSDHLIVEILKKTASTRKCKLTIQRYFITPVVYKDFFVGDLVGGTEIADGLCTMTFKDYMYYLQREICRVRIQSLCNNKLFDTICTLVKGDYKVTAIILLSPDGKIITLPPLFPPRPSNYFTQGIVVFNGISRHITNHSGSDLYINLPIDGLQPGDEIDVYPGCDKTPVTCDTKFAASNLANFVGMPYIPTKDQGLIPLTSSGS